MSVKPTLYITFSKSETFGLEHEILLFITLLFCQDSEAYTRMQTRWSFYCSQTQSLDVDEDWYQNFCLLPSQICQRFLCICDKYQNFLAHMQTLQSKQIFSSVSFKGFEVEKFSEY